VIVTHQPAIRLAGQFIAVAGTATSQSIESFRKTDINKNFDKQLQNGL
jgi:hypothetical protein